ncbi:HBL/NHE enterotoxin family protein [Microcystis aeruginosa BLCCF158]|uniref:HBL/NHE enterotoxin family protein n=1 Tax=Microcystis aeruginosa BLCC-F158 TaxID=2755316 RepID=A0A841UVR4_MICAE|nr:HBL/NHE enterotoxin family protein [Microcystis aeruginosa]MBC1195131.1 HBL/NHE enterotoxin family protein [Microcystis aeruginosa BLCC-F158]
MIENLIDQIDNYARKISEDKNLPESTSIIKQHTAKFSQTYKPQLQNDIRTIKSFVQQYETVKPDLNRRLSAWKTGDKSAPLVMLDILNKLSATLKDVIQTNYKAFSNMSEYRNTILTDEQILNANANQLNSQLAGLKSRLNSKEAERRTIIERHSILVGILGSLGWASEELANLIVRHKTVEQDISDLTQQSNSLSNQTFQTNYALQTIQQLSSTMNTLENSLQNIVNSLTFTDKYMGQAIQSLHSASGANMEVVVEAYLNALAEQITLFSQS